MLVTLENNLTIDMLVPEKVFYRIVCKNGSFKDFTDKDDAEEYLYNLWDFFGNFKLYKVTQCLDDFGKVVNTIFEEF